MAEYIVATNLEFPHSIFEDIFDDKMVKQLPFLESFFNHVVESMDIVETIESYADLVDYFQQRFEGEDDIEKTSLFKKCKKLLNKSFDIYVVETSDTEHHINDFFTFLNKIKNFVVIDFDE